MIIKFIIISIPLARKYAGIGAAMGTMIANVLGQILTMNIYYWKKLKIDIPSYWKRFITYVIPITIISLLIMKLIENIKFNFITLIISIIVYTLMYFTYAYLYMNNEEKSYVKKVFNKILRRKA